MSRSIRNYNGLSHTWSDTKQGKTQKKQTRKKLRSKLKYNYEEYSPIGKKCCKSNLYDGVWIKNEDDAKEFSKRKSKGYNHKRIIHKLIGK